MADNWYEKWLAPTDKQAQMPILLATPPVTEIEQLIPKSFLENAELVLLPTEGKLPITLIQETLAKTHSTSTHQLRLVWIPGAERLTSITANALLKTLEEAPASNRFLLSTAYPGRILRTIQSRCRRVRMPYQKHTATNNQEIPVFEAKGNTEVSLDAAEALGLQLQRHIAEHGVDTTTYRKLMRLRDYYKITAQNPGNKLASAALLATLIEN